MIRSLTKQSRHKTLNQTDSAFTSNVIAGLSTDPKTLPCKYFYDERGSVLFDAICDLDEYYLTRTELEIMHQYAPEMVQAMGAGATLIELGSGSSVKTRLLLDRLTYPAAYVPVDISREHLLHTARRLSRHYPTVAVQPLFADFTEDFNLPPSQERHSRRIVYFPGSTIGNFERAEATKLLDKITKLCGPDGGLLIGIDLQKNIATIESAYNDAQGLTAQFNLNLLSRINRELGGNFDLEQFEHLAFYDSMANRVDLRLVSRRNQSVDIGSETFCFRAGEHIRTEYSHKYTIEQFEGMASDVGLCLQNYWTDNRQYFAVLFFGVRVKKAR